MITPHHAKYYAHELTAKKPAHLIDRLTYSLVEASVDLNPHQIEAALFALRSPLSKGVILADEVGLGKTIEAGLLLCQYWAEHKRHLLIICPASLRRQWSIELEEKFRMPSLILESKTYQKMEKDGMAPLMFEGAIIMSFHFAARMKDELQRINWHLCVIDEAHKLRNVYKKDNKMGKAICEALQDIHLVGLAFLTQRNADAIAPFGIDAGAAYQADRQIAGAVAGAIHMHRCKRFQILTRVQASTRCRASFSFSSPFSAHHRAPLPARCVQGGNARKPCTLPTYSCRTMSWDGFSSVSRTMTLYPASRYRSAKAPLSSQ